MLQSVAIFAGDKTSHKCLEQLFLFAESNWAFHCCMENKTVLNDISGGPGSGKVSHSERLSQELICNGILHLNVTELLKDIFRLNGKWLK